MFQNTDKDMVNLFGAFGLLIVVFGVVMLAL